MNVMPFRQRDLERALFSSLDRKKLPTKAHPQVESLFLHGIEATDFAKFPNVRELCLRRLREPLPTLRAANALANLDSLLLADMTLDPLPEELRAMTRLRWLELEDVELASLPSWIAELDALEALSLEQNPLTTLPDEITTLAKLQALTLGSYEFRTPKLQRLPASFERLEALSYLYLYPTELAPADIERLLRMPSLRHFGMYDAELPSIVGELTKLESLSIEDAGYTAVPDFVGNLTELRELRLLLMPVRDVPAWLPNLQKLERLFVHTQIEMDMDAFVDLVVQLPKLQCVYLWGAASKAAKKKLVGAGLAVVRGNWHVWVRGDADVRPSMELYPWR
jgi:hypothetical protein